MIKVVSFIILFLTFSSFPYIGNYVFGSFYILVSSGLIALISAVLIPKYFSDRLLTKRSEEWLLIWFIYLLSVLFYALFLGIREETLIDFRRFIVLFFKVLFVFSCFVLVIRSNELVNIFLKVNCLIALLSIILFVLLTSGLPFPFFTFTKLDGREHYFFFIGASNVFYNWEGVTTLRIAGFADEPGAFALMLNYFLIVNEVTFKNSYYRWIFSIAGVLTFSLAFYLTFILFISYWLISGVINFKRVVLLTTLGVAIFISFSVVYQIEALSKIFDIMFDRFQYDDSTGTFVGDNRSGSFALQLQAINDNIFLGLGDNVDEKAKYELYNPSMISFIANYGFFGVIFFLLPVYSLIVKYIRTKEVLLILVLLISYFQRPGIEDMFSMLSLSFIYTYSNNKFRFG